MRSESRNTPKPVKPGDLVKIAGLTKDTRVADVGRRGVVIRLAQKRALIALEETREERWIGFSVLVPVKS